MSVKDLLAAWDEAAQRLLGSDQENEFTPIQLASATGMRVRTDISAGLWDATKGLSTRPPFC